MVNSVEQSAHEVLITLTNPCSSYAVSEVVNPDRFDSSYTYVLAQDPALTVSWNWNDFYTIVDKPTHIDCEENPQLVVEYKIADQATSAYKVHGRFPTVDSASRTWSIDLTSGATYWSDAHEWNFRFRVTLSNLSETTL